MLDFAYINLNNLLFNAKQIKKLLGKEKFCAVVKADAYGHGAEKVAAALYPVIDCFAVALVEEGISLRLSGIDKEILVFNIINESDIEKAIRYNLTVSVASLSQAKMVYTILKKEKKSIKIHIKVNTGMNRLGVSVKELEGLCRYFSDKRELVKVEGLYSHLSDPEDDVSVKRATSLFLLAKKILRDYNYKVISHISASGGALKGIKSDMARIGIMLYGYKPFKSDKITLKPVMKVVAPVICRRTLKKGEPALYGKVKAKKKTDISIVRYGYADGLERRNIDEQFNNRCMDVTAIEGKTEGNFYTVMEDAELIAESYGTIPYEILTKIALRAEKIYIR